MVLECTRYLGPAPSFAHPLPGRSRQQKLASTLVQPSTNSSITAWWNRDRSYYERTKVDIGHAKLREEEWNAKMRVLLKLLRMNQAARVILKRQVFLSYLHELINLWFSHPRVLCSLHPPYPLHLPMTELLCRYQITHVLHTAYGSS